MIIPTEYIVSFKKNLDQSDSSFNGIPNEDHKLYELNGVNPSVVLGVNLFFHKKLTKSEIETRMVHLPKDIAKLFPRNGFEITIDGVQLKKKIDKYNRIFLNVKAVAKAGDTIEFYKKPNGSYEVSFRPT